MPAGQPEARADAPGPEPDTLSSCEKPGGTAAEVRRGAGGDRLRAAAPRTRVEDPGRAIRAFGAADAGADRGAGVPGALRSKAGPQHGRLSLARARLLHQRGAAG